MHLLIMSSSSHNAKSMFRNPRVDQTHWHIPPWIPGVSYTWQTSTIKPLALITRPILWIKKHICNPLTYHQPSPQSCPLPPKAKTHLTSHREAEHVNSHHRLAHEVHLAMLYSTASGRCLLKAEKQEIKQHVPCYSFQNSPWLEDFLGEVAIF